MPSKMETARASPRIREKTKHVEALAAEVKALQARSGAVGPHISAYPPGQHASKAPYYAGGRGQASAGQHPHGGAMIDPRVWYEKERALMTAELKKEKMAMEEELQKKYQLHFQHYQIQLESQKLQRLEDLQLKKEIRMREEMEYHAKVGKKEDIMIVTTAKVPGYRIKDVCGAVMGFGLIEACDDEEDTEEETMLSPYIARAQAVESMVADAQRAHANAVVSFQWIIRPLDVERTKVLAQGTAIIIEKDGPVQCNECGTVKKKQKGEGGGGGGDNHNQKGNSENHDHSHDHSTSSVGGPAAPNAQKQKQQNQKQQKQKGKGGSGNANGGGKNNGQTTHQQNQQGKKNKGKQNNNSKIAVDDSTVNDNDNEQRPDDDDNDAQSSDADVDDETTPASKNGKNQKGKGNNNNNQNQGSGGGGGGKGGKGQKLTATQQIVKLLAESKIREDRRKTEETEKERLYKHMEEFFKGRGSGGGWGGSSQKEMTTMDWLKKIEKEIEERNKKKNTGGSSSGGGVGGGWGGTETASAAPTETGWGVTSPQTANSTTTQQTAGWGVEEAAEGSPSKPDNNNNNNNNNKGKQKNKGKGKQNDNHSNNGSGSNNEPAAVGGWGGPEASLAPTQDPPQNDQAQSTTGAWGDNANAEAGGSGGQDAWGDAEPNGGGAAPGPSSSGWV